MNFQKTVWDGRREMSQRRVIDQTDLDAEGMGLTITTEDVREPTDWCFDRPHHTIVVHLAGELDRMETVFDGEPGSGIKPAIGDVWVIPAARRYAALASGDRVCFAELKVPVGMGRVEEVEARVAHHDPFLHHGCSKAAALAARSDAAAKLALDSLLHLLRFHVADAYLGGVPTSECADKADRRAFSLRQRKLLTEYVHAHKQGQIKVEQLADALGVSMSHLLAGFRASFGTTPWQYIMRARLSEASQLLSDCDLSITAISVASGYANPSHFATAFGRQFGVSPTEYRHRMRGH